MGKMGKMGNLSELLAIKDSFISDLEGISTLPDLQQLYAKFVGKKGSVTLMMKGIATLTPEERKTLGKEIHQLKSFIETSIKDKEDILKTTESANKISANSIDVTLPGYYKIPGGSHPLSLIIREIASIFTSMGFSIEEGPEIETDYYNFVALNFPKNHPARDMQDTFYVDSGKEDIVLRTHTSPVQIRVMEKTPPPLKIISLGKVYRCDADTTHSPIFHQVEGLMVDKDITFANLKAILSDFLKRIFPDSIGVRFRPSFFPFTEPSVEVDMGCIFCKGSGCNVCKHTGWLEILGAGMVDPRVFKQVGINDSIYSGFAFGIGIERVAMLKFGIDDIRLFYESDLRFIRQF